MDKDMALENIKLRIKFDEDIFGDEDTYNQAMQDLLDDSIYIALTTLYPFEDFSDYKVPNKHLNWIVRCAVELYQLADKSGIINYSENNINWAKRSDGLSVFLMSQLTSKIGTAKKVEEV